MKTNGKNGIERVEGYTGPRQKVMLVNGREKIFFFISKHEAFTSLTAIAKKFDVELDLLMDMYNNTNLSIADCISSLKETDKIAIPAHPVCRKLEDVVVPTDLSGFYKPEIQHSSKQVKKSTTNHSVDPVKSAYLTGVPHRGVICRFKGVEYISLAALERAYGLPSTTISHARRRHPEIANNIDAIMDLVLNGKKRSKRTRKEKTFFKRASKPIEAYGVSYPSQTAMSKELGMHANYVAQGLYRGLTPEKIVDNAKKLIAKKTKQTA